MNDALTFFSEWDPAFLAGYLVTVMAVAAVGYAVGWRMANQRRLEGARRRVLCVLAAVAFSVFVHPVHAMTLAMGLLGAGVLVGLQVVAVTGAMGLIGGLLVDGAVALWRRFKAGSR